MNSNEFVVSIADKTQMEHVLDLVVTQYSGIFASERYWNWRYFENPVAPVRLYTIVTGRNRIVAIQAVTSFDARIGQTRKGKLHLLTAAITHEDFRRRGLFRKLIEQVQKDLFKSEEDMGYTIPNPQSKKAFERFECWEKQQNFQWWIRLFPVRFSCFGKKREDLNIHQDSIHNHSLDPLGSSGNWFIDRKPDYINWRYGPDAPFSYRIDVAERSGSIVGYLITRPKIMMGLNLCVICDLVAESKDVFCKLLMHASRIASENRMKGAGLLLGKGLLNAVDLVSIGYVPVPELFARRDFPLFTCLGGSNLPNRQQDVFIMLGDTDLI